MMKRVVTVVWITATCLITSAEHLYGCTCLSVPLKRRFNGATDVFVGKFTAVKPGWRGEPESVIVMVQRRFLGNSAGETKLDLAGMCSTSGARVGGEALVFAERNRTATLHEIACASVSADAAKAQQEIRTLRRRAWWWRIQRRIRKSLATMFNRHG